MGVGRMITLAAHLRALKTWIFFGGRHRLFLFLSSIPVLWIFWEICSPALISGKIDLKNTFLSLFAAWYSLSYLQDFTNSNSNLGLSGSFYLPACPALPISPLMRIGAELLFFFIISILLIIPLFCLHLLSVLPLGEKDYTAGLFLLTAFQGTLAIAPIIFCIRMNVNGAFILPATLRMAMPVVLCGTFFLFQITGLFSTWIGSTALFVIQIAILSAIFIWFRGQNNWPHGNRWVKYLSRYFLDDAVIQLLLGNKVRRSALPANLQVVMDLGRIMLLYLAYWVCFYFPLMGSLYYLFIKVLDQSVMNWFFFLLLLLLPSQDSLALKDRFLTPVLALPVRQGVAIWGFYFLFAAAVAVIWSTAFFIVFIVDSRDHLSLLPLILIFAPTTAGIWVNRMIKNPAIAYAGVALLCCLPVGYYMDLSFRPILLCGLIGALLPLGGIISKRQKA